MVRGLADIGAEGVLLAGAGRAILLQIADPAVGRGVAAHSNFAQRPLDRLLSTMTYVYAVVYGSEAQVAAVRRSVNRAHAPVRSHAGAGGGSGYSAFDAHSQLWVVATLYDTAATVHEKIYGPLDDVAADRVYRDYARTGTALQLPAELWPEDRAAFAEYWHERLPILEVEEATRRVARDLLFPAAGPVWLRAAMPLARFLTAGLLPEGLRADFGLAWSGRHERRFNRTMRLTALTYPRLPRRLRHWFKDYCLERLDAA
ncbi:oxygenase MpaB family protein [Pseudarthrobacter sp. J75]|uniref:oxygenase MpaB family protein n=1 Tax=unclassified Pseudarthrobacter TaxID=2647000 RepID=UPI002E816892|nr:MULTISPECIES: oxygenase MpaB family protein [unclassified Pseudarthrobacter]MEE2524254.1 oxygenase MpaB family protein [Pseudarthrobacter sp. J47]MEE2530150.1 oxygenase MpaB family protein [Pseudarthrobacter sp. J75]